MYRQGIPLIPQEELAYALGLTVPKKDMHLFEKVHKQQRPSSGWGTHVQDKDYEFDTVMQKLKLPLRARYYLADKITSTTNLLETLREVQAEGCDILVCFDYDMLWGKAPSNGHVCVFNSVSGNDIWLVDPEQNVPKFRKVPAKKLYDAIQSHGADNMAGLWLIENTTKKN
jgi:hypothetical protein